MLWANHYCFTETEDTPSIDRCKAKLGLDCFRMIRFDTMASSEFSACIFQYPGMFSTAELEQRVIAIETQRSINGLQPRSTKYFNDDGFIVCSRIATKRISLHLLQSKQVVRFSVSSNIFLHAIQIAKQTQIPEFPCKDRISNSGYILRVGLASIGHRTHTQAIEFDMNEDNRIKVEPPIYIHADRIMK